MPIKNPRISKRIPSKSQVDIGEIAREKNFPGKQFFLAFSIQPPESVSKNCFPGIPFKTLKKSKNNLTFSDYARSLAAFIRDKFRIKETKLEFIEL